MQHTRPRRRRPGVLVGSLLVVLVASGCSGSASPSAAGASRDPGAAPGGTIRLYTSVTQDTVDAVLAAFAESHPQVQVDLFRAPTGEIDARIAAERREGSVLADVLWGTDPLSTRQYDAQGLLRSWRPLNAGAIPEAYRQDAFWGTRLLNVVIVARADLDPAPVDWGDLADAAYRDEVALADPGFAGSSLGTLAYFALSGDYGFDYLRALAENGATQVQSVGDVITGVAEGQFQAGLALDKSVRDAVAAGSPLQLIWPRSGAIAVYSPISIFDSTRNAPAAEAFVDFVLGTDAQAAIASTGWQPVRTDVAWTLTGGAQVTPDWEAAFERRDQLLNQYRSIFGG